MSSINFTHSRGRPSVAEQIKIDGILWPYFLKTFSISKTAELTKFNRKTVAKRFKRWYAEKVAEINNERGKNDIKIQIEYANIIQTLIEDRLEQLDKIRTDIDNARTSGDESLPQLLSIENNVAKTIEMFADKRFVIRSYPGAALFIDKTVKEKMEKYAQASSAN